MPTHHPKTRLIALIATLIPTPSYFMASLHRSVASWRPQSQHSLSIPLCSHTPSFKRSHSTLTSLRTFRPLAVLNGAGTRKVSDDILGNTDWFNRWLDGEKQFALSRFEEIMDSPDAWAIGSSDSLADDDEQIIHSSLNNSSASAQAAEGEAGQRTTKSARSLIEILDSVSERYRPLPSLPQRLSFLAIVQLPILRSYAQRLTRSLDAFESLSSAFARAMPGEIVPGTVAPSSLVSMGSDSDMVKVYVVWEGSSKRCSRHNTSVANWRGGLRRPTLSRCRKHCIRPRKAGRWR